MTLLLLATAFVVQGGPGEKLVEIPASGAPVAHFACLERLRPKQVLAVQSTTRNGLHPVYWIYEVHKPYAEFAQSMALDFGRVRFDESVALSKDSRGASSLFTMKKTSEQSVTVTVVDTPSLVEKPSNWPAKAKAGPISEPKVPLGLVSGVHPVGERQWFGQGAAGVEYSYVFKESAESLARRLKSQTRPAWEPSEGPREQYRLWLDKSDTHRGREFWAAGVRTVDSRKDVSLLIVTRGVVGGPRL